jgi:HSP20 family molecular chaperone IbpA
MLWKARKPFAANSNTTASKEVFSLDEKIDASNIQAKYENGILKIELPRNLKCWNNLNR